MNQALPSLIPAFLIAAIIAAISAPLWRRFCRQVGLIDAPGHRKIHDKPLPLAGGITVFTGITIAAASAWLLHSLQFELNFIRELSTGLGATGRRFGGIAAGALGMFVLGLLDDRFELRPSAKFLGQLCVAAGAALGGIRLGVFSEHPALQLVVTIFWILAATNAFNFIDNMNGLCAGLCIVTAISITIIAGRSHANVTAVFATSLAGAALGFLPFNYPKATAFLGDSGSHLIGFALGTLTIDPGLWSGTAIPAMFVLGPALLLAVPLIDLCWVVCYRTYHRRPFYLGDKNHLSHQLVRIGLPTSTAVALLWAASAAGCVAAILLH